LNEAQRIANLGYWEWDIITGAVRSSDEFARILGFRPRELSGTYEEIFDFIHPDDRPAVREAINWAFSHSDAGYSIEHRMVRRDGSVCVVHGRGEVVLDATGRPVRMFGTVHDITARKQAEAELRQALDEIKTLKDRLESENVYLWKEMDLKDGYRDIVGTSDPIRYAIHRTRQIARSNATVLLTGETGVGKGIFARFLHRVSDRKDKSFVNVNCAGLPANLIESELFGREKGAFTGATARQIGRFELANGGTIFLDEIGELPFDSQAKLLGVIENAEFERLGSPYPVRVDVRIIASTNRNLEDEITSGRFRRDLFYRLNVFPITIPPLRQRREDIPLLVRHFVAQFNKKHGKRVSSIPEKTMEALEGYEWPGNVRELMNAMERSVILSEGPEIRLADGVFASGQGAVREAVTPRTNPRTSESLADVDRAHILSTLERVGWRIEGPKGAARLLDMNPSTLRTRMKMLDIRRPGA